jgi:hypothetical protein
MDQHVIDHMIWIQGKGKELCETHILSTLDLSPNLNSNPTQTNLDTKLKFKLNLRRLLKKLFFLLLFLSLTITFSQNTKNFGLKLKFWFKKCWKNKYLPLLLFSIKTLIEGFYFDLMMKWFKGLNWCFRVLAGLKQTDLMFGIMGCWRTDCVIVKSVDLKTNTSGFWNPDRLVGWIGWLVVLNRPTDWFVLPVGLNQPINWLVIVVD